MSTINIWDVRADEPEYARLRHQDPIEVDNLKADVPLTNVYDQPIDLIALMDETVPRGQSLFINGNDAVGDNPNRNKQHAFYFNADNCIGCHACESACAEKNETPAHLAFRSVGYVEGGSFPDFQRMNISMACNHCDDPVCLKGCPTNAYTKHTEYGAVLQDPDTCFGCGYCTWVCPYNAPQLDPIEGQVSKCNMCVDRLEVGLKPSCVSACVGNALDFGVVEDIPENREQAKTAIPGFPDPSISQPNIRFEQKKGLPEEMTRTDSAPLKYHLDKTTGNYKPALDPKTGRKKYWNIARLSSRENPLVLFTLFTQAGIGAFAIPFLGSLFGLDAMTAFAQSSWYALMPFVGAALAAFALFLSTTHLGKPMRFYRGFNNLRYSPVSREGLGVAIFMGFAGLHWLLVLPQSELSIVKFLAGLTGLLAVIGAAGGLFYMHKCYRIPARPFWNHWQTATSFGGNTLSLGALIAGGFALLAAAQSGGDTTAVLQAFGWFVALGLVIEVVGLIAHAKSNVDAEHEGAASHYIQTTTFGKTYIARNSILGILLVSVIGLLTLNISGVFAITAWSLVAVTLLMLALVSRALFYILVVPTTMPGAFFWRNKGFEQHAKDIGLADVVDMGVVSNRH
jgi:DMSO reductase iron-sulfur subunit